MNLQHIRSLAEQAMGTPTTTPSPEMAVFYASILYSKTQTAPDAYFYATALAQNGEYRRAVRVLEEVEYMNVNNGINVSFDQQQQQNNTNSNPMEATLLICQCLAHLGEWQEASMILQEASKLPPAGNQTNGMAATVLMDDDEAGWEALGKLHAANSKSRSNSTVIHPVARLCLWRAKCYDATSHPPRAKLYWKRALQIDYQCVAALDSLLDRNLLTPDESLSLVESLRIPPPMDWLYQMYLARLPVVVVTGGSDAADNENQPPPSFLNEQSMMASPGGISMIQHRQDTPTAATPAADDFDSKPPASSSVDTALHKLCHVHQLSQSPEVLALAAIRAYRRYDLQSAFQYCQELIRVDPLTPRAAFCHAATLLALNYKRLLFALAHEWVKASPQAAKSWFAVGCYYYCCQRYHIAQQHFLRATRLDPNCQDAWIAFGCAFAACDESDQALASFRAAQRLAPAESCALLYMGMEYVRTNHLVLAQHALMAALPGGDPLCWHELGVVQYAKRDYETAISWFSKALRAIVQLESRSNGDNTYTCLDADDAIDVITNVYWEPTLFNLGHCYRKTLQFDQAVACFEKCLVLIPNNASALVALGFTHHLSGSTGDAIESYHAALAIQSEHAFCAELLSRALEEALSGKLSLHSLSDTNKSQQQPPTTPSSSMRTKRRTPRSARSAAFSLGSSISGGGDDSSTDDVDMSMG